MNAKPTGTLLLCCLLSACQLQSGAQDTCKHEVIRLIDRADGLLAEVNNLSDDPGFSAATKNDEFERLKSRAVTWLDANECQLALPYALSLKPHLLDRQRTRVSQLIRTRMAELQKQQLLNANPVVAEEMLQLSEAMMLLQAGAVQNAYAKYKASGPSN